MSSPALSDAELVRKCQTGEWRAYNELIARHQDRLFNLIYRYLGHWEDARDVCQEVFLKALKALPDFRGDAAFGTWLHQIGINAVISWRRGKHGHPTASLDNSGGDGANDKGVPDPPDESPGPAQLADHRERERFVQQAISLLEEQQRILVVLRDVQGYGYEEIAHLLGCPRGTVKSRLHRARLILRERLRPLVQQEQKK